jgi:hypothetical protein
MACRRAGTPGRKLRIGSGPGTESAGDPRDENDRDLQGFVSVTTPEALPPAFNVTV